MLKAGKVLFLLWSGLNFLVAAAVTVMTVLNRPPPALALMLSSDEIATVEPKAIAVIQAQAAIANPVIMALCALSTLLVFKALHERWARVAVWSTLLPVQIFGFVSDSFLGGRNLVANAVSSVVLLAALALLSRAVSRPASS